MTLNQQIAEMQMEEKSTCKKSKFKDTLSMADTPISYVEALIKYLRVQTHIRSVDLSNTNMDASQFKKLAIYLF